MYNCFNWNNEVPNNRQISNQVININGNGNNYTNQVIKNTRAS